MCGGECRVCGCTAPASQPPTRSPVRACLQALPMLCVILASLSAGQHGKSFFSMLLLRLQGCLAGRCCSRA